MKITSKGQITIPQKYRDQFGFLPNTEIEFVADKGELKLVKPGKLSGRGKRIADHLIGRGDGLLSTDEILRLSRGEP